MKKLLIAAIILVLSIANYVTTKYIPIEGFNYIFFIPVIISISMLLKNDRSILLRTLIYTLGGLIYIAGSSFFKIDPMLNNGAWCLVGAIITYLSILLFKYAKKEGAKEIKQKEAESINKSDEKSN